MALNWKNIFGHKKTFHANYKLSELAQGWYNTGHLIKPKDLPEQMQQVTKSLNEIHRDIEGISRDIRLKPIMEDLDKINIKKTNTSRKKQVK